MKNWIRCYSKKRDPSHKIQDFTYEPDINNLIYGVLISVQTLRILSKTGISFVEGITEAGLIILAYRSLPNSMIITI